MGTPERAIVNAMVAEHEDVRVPPLGSAEHVPVQRVVELRERGSLHFKTARSAKTTMSQLISHN